MEVLTMLRYLKEMKEVFKVWAAAKNAPAKTAALTALRTTRANKAKEAGRSATRALKRLDTLWSIITSLKTARWGRMMEDLTRAMDGKLRTRSEAVFTRKIRAFSEKTRVSTAMRAPIGAYQLSLPTQLTFSPSPTSPPN